MAGLITVSIYTAEYSNPIFFDSYTSMVNHSRRSKKNTSLGCRQRLWRLWQWLSITITFLFFSFQDAETNDWKPFVCLCILCVAICCHQFLPFLLPKSLPVGCPSCKIGQTFGRRLQDPQPGAVSFCEALIGVTREDNKSDCIIFIL